MEIESDYNNISFYIAFVCLKNQANIAMLDLVVDILWCELYNDPTKKETESQTGKKTGERIYNIILIVSLFFLHFHEG